MKSLRKHLERIRKLKRHQHHPLLHKIHKKHGISKKTLFYIKEYGPHSNVPKTIIKESIKILLLASIVSSLGGLALENIKTIFISIMPLIILLPTLNGMIGSYGTIVSSRFSTILHEGKIKNKVWSNPEIKDLFSHIIFISVVGAVFSSILAFVLSAIFGYDLEPILVGKIFLITIIDTVLLSIILFFIAVVAGLYFWNKKEDPNNFLIPITTSVADFGNMIVLTVLVLLFF